MACCSLLTCSCSIWVSCCATSSRLSAGSPNLNTGTGTSCSGRQSCSSGFETGHSEGRQGSLFRTTQGRAGHRPRHHQGNLRYSILQSEPVNSSLYDFHPPMRLPTKNLEMVKQFSESEESGKYSYCLFPLQAPRGNIYI